MKTKLFLLSILVFPFLASCGETFNYEKKINDDDLLINKRSYAFTNLTDEYEINTDNMDLYFIGDSDVAYVSASEFINDLDGLFDLEKLTTNKDDKSIAFKYTYDKDNIYSMSVNWYENFISFNSNDFTSVICKETGNTDYSSHFEMESGNLINDKPVKFNLDKYHFDIFNYQDNCLVPLCIYNALICATNYYNVMFNGDKIFGYYGEIDYDEPEYKAIYSSSLNNKKQSSYMREATYNSLCFMIDYFYGIKDDRNIKTADSFISLINKNYISSQYASDNVRGYLNLLYSQMDDLHTRLDSGSYYSERGYVPSISYNLLGKHSAKYYDSYYDLNDYRNYYLGEEVPPVRYIGNNAIITLNSFRTAPNNVIFDEHGNVKDDAWEYDSYYFMDHVFKDIVKHGNIDNVLIDISLNGGGNIGALIRVLGFLTNENIPYVDYDTLATRAFSYKYKVDTNADDKYDDNDAYTQFNYALLTSTCSYSAANTFASTFEDLNIGKIIGEDTGGGACSILPLTLADGTFFAISSNYCSSKMIETPFSYSFPSIEEGIGVNYSIDYENFYNDQYLANTLNNLFK